MSAALDLLDIFVDNMIPVLAIAAVGVALRRRFHIEPAAISRMMFYVFAPALAFHALYTQDISGAEFLRMYLGTLALLTVIALISYAVLRPQHIKPSERAAALVASFVFNGANFGLSIVSFAFGAEALSYAVIAYVAGSTVAWTVGVYVSSQGAASIRAALRNVLGTPVIYALALAFALKALGIDHLPPALGRTSRLLADAAIPLMLVLLGLQLGRFAMPDRWRLVASGTVIRLLLAPLAAVIIAPFFELAGPARFAFIVQAGMPTAVLTLVLAHQFDTDRDLTLSFIVTSTLISPLTLTVLIYLLRNGII
ncbi:MAG: AEC family transporter [Chloroflexota bacterium]|nr:AEC family transporter [Chloroflexota bacterium]MDE2946577.1 AEC family transporter [Chloroflexota bacterium]